MKKKVELSQNCNELIPLTALPPPLFLNFNSRRSSFLSTRWAWAMMVKKISLFDKLVCD
jgi:hypothetical protein